MVANSVYLIPASYFPRSLHLDTLTGGVSNKALRMKSDLFDVFWMLGIIGQLLSITFQTFPRIAAKPAVGRPGR